MGVDKDLQDNLNYKKGQLCIVVKVSEFADNPGLATRARALRLFV